MTILVLNAGSSTLKFSLFAVRSDQELCSGMVDWQGELKNASLTIRSSSTGNQQSQVELADYGDAVSWALRALLENGFDQPIQFVGHRVVHGGTEFRESVLINEQVIRSLQTISKLAPLHHPPVLATFDATRKALPETPQVAVFDTSFFARLPDREAVYPLPYAWYEKYGIRRFGFHGISHAYCSVRAAKMLGRTNDPDLRLVICHLGNGCSATAVRGGKPVTTTMGFTPLEGLMMGTRCGSVDPGILVYLMQEHGFDSQKFEETLNRQSGLLGVSGVSSDYRLVKQAAVAGNQRASLAIDMFADRVRSAIGSLSVTLGGIDALVFTAGIGENSAAMRSQVCKGLGCLGLLLDETFNQTQDADCDIAMTNSVARILVVRTQEEQMVASEVRKRFVKRRSSRR